MMCFFVDGNQETTANKSKIRWSSCKRNIHGIFQAYLQWKCFVSYV